MAAILLAFLAALGFGSAAVFVRVGLQQMKSPVGAFLSLVASFVLIAALALILNLDAILALPLIAFLWFILLGLLNYPLGRVLTFASVSLVGASRATPLIASAPLFAAIFALTFLGERPNILIGMGTMTIIGGLALVVSEGGSGARQSGN